MFLNLFFSDRTQPSAAGGPSPSGAVASHHAFPPHKQQSDRELLSRDRRAGGAATSSTVAAMHHPTRLYIPLQVRAPLATLSPSTPPNASTPTKGAAVGGSTITHGAHPHHPLYQPHNHHIYQAPASQTGAPPGAVPAFRRGSFLYRATDSDSEDGSDAPSGWPAGAHSRKRSSGSVALLGGWSRGSIALDGYVLRF